jgi:hypothetical protein
VGKSTRCAAYPSARASSAGGKVSAKVRGDVDSAPCVVLDPYYGWVNVCPYSYYY